MKRTALVKHLRESGCVLLREGSRHSWWHNPLLNRRSAVPRHTEIIDSLARKICKDLGIPLAFCDRQMLTDCPHCHARVIPMSGQICPSCQAELTGQTAENCDMVRVSSEDVQELPASYVMCGKQTTEATSISRRGHARRTRQNQGDRSAVVGYASIAFMK